MRGILNHLRGRRARLDGDLERELAYHIERRVAELVAGGASDAEARRRANLDLGGLTQVREAVRETWTWPTLDALVLDLRYAIRTLRKSRGFALGVGAVLTLALAANIVVFAVVNAVLLEPLPYPNAERLVAIETLWTNTGRTTPDVSGPDYLDWRAQSDVFAAMAAFYSNDYSNSEVPTVVGERAVFANVRSTSGDFFGVFAQSAAAGRLLTERDAEEGVATVVVAYDWAAAHFGSADAAVGKRIRVYGGDTEIVGVAAPGFRYPDGADIWGAGAVAADGDRSDHVYRAVARLKPGVALSEAQAKMRTIAAALAEVHPDNRLKSTMLVALKDQLTEPVRGTLWLLMVASGAVLLIASTNIAGLLLARATERARELAVRAALGAGRARVARQLLMEGGVLVAASGAAGLLLAWLTTRLLLALSPLAALPKDARLVGPGVLLFALGTSLLALVSFAVVPALRVSRLDLMSGLRSGSKLVTPGGGPRWRSTLVVGQVALSVVLVVAAGLLLRSFVLLQHVELGYTRDRVVFAYMQHAVDESSPEAHDRTIRARIDFYAELLERLRRVPGVGAAAGVTFLPMGDEIRATRDMFVDGQPETLLGERPQAEFYAITPDFFATLGIPLLAGRDFTATTDTRGRPETAIVNEAFVQRVLGGEAALGQRVRWNERGPWWEIVGIVGDARWQAPGLPPQPTLFVPSFTGIGTSLSLAARTSLDEGALASTLQTLIRDLNPTVPVRIETMDRIFDSALARPRFLALVVGGFAAFAALLAAVGLFSVLAYMVGQRRRELALRQALGAQVADVVKMVVGQGLRLTAIGLLFGLGMALAFTRLLEGLLYGVAPWDAATYAGATVVLGVAAMLAAFLPACRAAAIAPATALQED